MAAAGLILAATLDLMQSNIRPGVTTGELDALAERYIRSHGAEPTFKGYRGFPGSICSSPNEMIVHGIPGRYKLAAGDIISIDVGVTLDGWVADAARTFPVEEIDARVPEPPRRDRAGAAHRHRAVRPGQPHGRPLEHDPAGLRGRRPGGRALADRPRRRAQHARGPAGPQLRQAGQGPAARGGHGARGRADDHAGRQAVRMGSDGWAIFSQDNSRAAHFEFTVAITAQGPRILTPWHLPPEQRTAAVLAGSTT